MNMTVIFASTSIFLMNEYEWLFLKISAEVNSHWFPLIFALLLQVEVEMTWCTLSFSGSDPKAWIALKS